MTTSDRMTLELRPLHGGSYTQFSLIGPVPSAPPGGLRQLLRMLAHWNGYPVNVALFVDARTGGWCETWSDALTCVPARHLEICFRVVAEGERP